MIQVVICISIVYLLVGAIQTFFIFRYIKKFIKKQQDNNECLNECPHLKEPISEICRFPLIMPIDEAFLKIDEAFNRMKKKG